MNHFSTTTTTLSFTRLVNVNYRGVITKGLKYLKFRFSAPHMATIKTNLGEVGKVTVVAFKSRKCRIMGCKTSLKAHSIRIKIDDSLHYLKISVLSIMSATATFNLEKPMTLRHLGDSCFAKGLRFVYEPEIFPALRLTCFNPMCVNVFGSGRCVVLGIRNLNTIEKIIQSIKDFINRS